MTKSLCNVPGCRRSSRVWGVCSAHYQQQAAGKPFTDLRADMSPEQRVEADNARFNRSYTRDGNGCWLWNGALTFGYGYFRDWSRKNHRAHRYSYELYVSEIPEGLVLDHLCRVRNCVNPDHLEAVTHRENTMRGLSPSAHNAVKEHCPQGHPYTDENTRYERTADGGFRRKCRECDRLRQQMIRDRKKQGEITDGKG